MDFARLRIVIFGSSIVSDWRNPLATSARAIVAALTLAGHDTLFLEERNNQWLVGLLKARGMAPARAFSAAYPVIQHRTYDLPRGRQPGVWFAQLVGTADAILALPGTPSLVLDQIADFHSQSVVRGVDAELDMSEADFIIGRASESETEVVFGPAVNVAARPAPSRSGIALIAYEPEHAETVRQGISGLDPVLIDEAPTQIGGWTYEPGVVLARVYDRCAVAVVVGDWRDRLTWARALLPAASGCRVIALGLGGNDLDILGITGLDDAGALRDVVCEFSHDASQSRIPEQFDASRQSRLLIDAIIQIQAEKRRTRR